MVTQVPKEKTEKKKREREAIWKLASVRSYTPRWEKQKEEMVLPQLKAWGHLVEPESTEDLSDRH